MQANNRGYFRATDHTLALTKAEDRERAGEAVEPVILMQTEQWGKALQAFFKRSTGIKALFLDFDGSMARFTEAPEQTLAVCGFLEAVKIFLDKGYKVAIITGRPIDGAKGIIAALQRSGADKTLIDKLVIFGSHGIEYRACESEGKVQISVEIAEKIAPYAEIQQHMLHDLRQHIEAHDELKNLGISFEPKTLGATIHYRAVEDAKRQTVKQQLAELLARLLPKTEDKENFSYLEQQTYKDFTYNSATESFEIRLNSATTGIEVNKGTSVKSLAQRWNVQVAIAFGDDTTDLDMQKRLQELIDDDSSSLAIQAFVGVKHDKSPREIGTCSTLVVEGQESAVELLKMMAELAEDQH